jgi:hypothetical protein
MKQQFYGKARFTTKITELGINNIIFETIPAHGASLVIFWSHIIYVKVKKIWVFVVWDKLMAVVNCGLYIGELSQQLLISFSLVY